MIVTHTDNDNKEQISAANGIPAGEQRARLSPGAEATIPYGV